MKFKKLATILVLSPWFISLLAPSLAFAFINYSVPNLGKAGTAAGSALVKSVKEETRVVDAGFQLTIPKGWTLNPVGESGQFLSSFNAHPTEFIQTDTVYFGVHRRKNGVDLKKIVESQRKKHRTVVEKNSASFQSVQIEYLGSNTNSQEEQILLWYVKAKVGSYLVLAGAPTTDKKNLAALRAVLSSLTFN